MPKFDVHAFPIVRVKVDNVEADSMTDAIVKADGAIDYYGLFERTEPHEVEYAEEVSHYLVDRRREGEEFSSDIDASEWFACDGETKQRFGYPEVVIKLVDGKLWQVYIPATVGVHVRNLRDRTDDESVADTTDLGYGAHSFIDGKLVKEGPDVRP